MAETVLREFLREESAEPDILLLNDPSPASGCCRPYPQIIPERRIPLTAHLACPSPTIAAKLHYSSVCHSCGTTCMSCCQACFNLLSEL